MSWILANPWRAGSIGLGAVAAGLLMWALVLDARLDAERAEGRRAAEAVQRLASEIDSYMGAAESAARAGRLREKEAAQAAADARRQAALPPKDARALQQVIAEKADATSCPTDERIHHAIDVLRAAG